MGTWNFTILGNPGKRHRTHTLEPRWPKDKGAVTSCSLLLVVRVRGEGEFGLLSLWAEGQSENALRQRHRYRRRRAKGSGGGHGQHCYRGSPLLSQPMRSPASASWFLPGWTSPRDVHLFGNGRKKSAGQEDVPVSAGQRSLMLLNNDWWAYFFLVIITKL